VQQLKENLKAVELKIPDEVMAKLDELYPAVKETPTI
ncbi:MAG: aldo/keto reductase, partial [Candidatus Latescibacterota bacterium]